MEFGLVALWIGVYLLLAALSLPLAAWLLSDLDYGAFTFPLSLAVLALVGHLFGYLSFGLPAGLAGLCVLCVLSWIAVRRIDVREDAHPRQMAEHALVFTLGFLLVVVIRGVDPAVAPLPVSVGEKFLDFGLLSTLERSQSLPPESMWFAGKPVKYHYGGHLFAAVLASLTRTDPAYAYNLALAGFYGTLVTTAYGLARSIGAHYRGSGRWSGVLGAFFVGLAGNLDTPIKAVVWLLPDGITGWLVETGKIGNELADWRPSTFSFWDASRVVPVDPRDAEPVKAATEVPLFAWINGDLHAHMMSQPVLLLVAAVLFGAWRADPFRRRVLVLGVVPPLVGVLAMFNIWSFPSGLGLTGLAVFFAPWNPVSLLTGSEQSGEPARSLILEELRRLAIVAGTVLVVAVGAVLWTLPFWLTSVLGGPDLSIEYWKPWTPAGPLFVVHGGFLVCFAVYLARQFATPKTGIAPLVLASVGLFATGAVVGAPGLFITVPLIAGCWILFRRSSDLDYEGVLIVAGAGLVLVVEVLTMETIRPERFNVIFKPYVHVWLFWSIGAAVVLPRLATGWASPAHGIDRRRLKLTGIALTVVLVVAMGLYPVGALYTHLEEGSETTDAYGMTLNGTAYLDVWYEGEAPAIRWLDREVSGQPAIVTAAPGGYWWEYDKSDGNFGGASAPASLTGIPTVAGWFHEAQYRGEDAFYSRVSDVRTIYMGSPATQRRLLERYDVRYIYVGPVEKEKYPEITVDELDAVRVANEWTRVTVYRVDQEALSRD